MNQILSITELTLSLKKHIESQFPAVCVKGEISNFKQQSSGHLYFTLKDAESQISAVLFKGNTKNLSRLPKEGDQVIVKGELSVYAPRGSYQILIRELQFSGVGELLLKLHQLKNALEQRGWLSPALKKPLPKFPKRIGIVTSPTGAVIQDIIHVLNRRFSGVHLILNPVRVQGEEAAAEIAKAIEQFNTYALADVLIVGRGGGSLEDLWPFNEEIVAKAIFESKIPIISAVGHETDFSIADFVADCRAPTPSAAAELVIGEKAHYLKQLDQTRARVSHSILASVKHHKQRLNTFSRQPCFESPTFLLSKYYQFIDDAENKLNALFSVFIAEKKLRLMAMQKQAFALKPTFQIASLKERLCQIDKTLTATTLRQLQVRKQECALPNVDKTLLFLLKQHLLRKKEKLVQLVSHLKAIDPKNLLTKGYCILFPEKGDSVILSIKDLPLESSVRIVLHDGEAKAKITERTP